MDPPFLQRLDASKYGCLTDVTLELSRLHALIGPNDSGKSTILSAARTCADMLAQVPVQPSFQTAIAPGLFDIDRPSRLAVKAGDVDFELRGVGRPSTDWIYDLKIGREKSIGRRSGELLIRAPVPNISPIADPLLGSVFGGARLLRLDPDALREPSTLIPETERLRLHDERGHGLPGVYDAILNRGDNSFHRIVDDLKRLFPTIRGLRLKNVSSSTKVLEVELTSREKVEARFMSEGLLYYLAFAAIPHLAPTSLLLVEEPENGLHPARISEIMKVLRENLENHTGTHRNSQPARRQRAIG